jgi:hypothetical protein
MILEGRRQTPPQSFWVSPAGKVTGSVSLTATVVCIKAGLAVALGVVIAAGIWFLELIARS